MKDAVQNLKNTVFKLADKFGNKSKRGELEELFRLLEQELARGPVQSQRIMALLRYIMERQPGANKAVNTFLLQPQIEQLMHRGGISQV